MREYRELTPTEREKFNDNLPEVTIGVIENGEVVALCGVIPTFHLDPLWIKPERRKSAFLLRRLWTAVSRNLRRRGISVVTGGILDGYPPPPYDEIVVKLCLRLAKGTEIKARFFGMELEQ